VINVPEECSMMPRRSPIPVRAAHDLSQRSSPPVKAGTPGEIIDMSENGLYSYTVTFHTVAAIGGATDGNVTLHDLCRADLREA
jgi:hypothetical protein